MTAKVLHILTALSLFFSTTGLKVSMHYCEDSLSGIALFKEASNCHEVASSCSVKGSSCKLSGDEKNCCDTDTEFFQKDIEKVNTSVVYADIDFSIAIFKRPQVFTNWSLLKSINIFKFYRPPPLNKDLLVLFETFRC